MWFSFRRCGRRDRARRSGGWRGALHGVPVAVKDFYDTAGVRTTAGFERFKDRVPRQDADVVVALDRAGAILLGKTNMHQLGMGTTGLESGFGAVRNPWNDAFIPGGSSSGSAAAVAAGLCYATIDTDAIRSSPLYLPLRVDSVEERPRGDPDAPMSGTDVTAPAMRPLSHLPEE